VSDPVPPAEPAPPKKKRSVKGLVGFVLGVALLVYVFVSRDGVDVLLEVVERVGDRWPLLLVPYALNGIFAIACYRVALPRRGRDVPLGVLVHVERSAAILTSVLPFANYGGNFAKVILLSHWYTGAEVLAAGAWGALATGICNSLAAIGPFVALAMGFAEPSGVALVAAATIATSFPALFILTMVRKGLARRVTSLLRHFPRLFSEERREKWLGKAEDFDRHLSSAVGERKGDFTLHVLLKACVQVARVGEIWLIIELLGLPGGLLAALLFNAINRTTAQLLSFVPGGFGVLELSAMIGFSALGFSTEDGLAVALALRFHFFVNMLVSASALATAPRVRAKYPPRTAGAPATTEASATPTP